MIDRRRAALGAGLLVTLALRLPGVFELPLDFHPIRQYHGAQLIRRFAPSVVTEASAGSHEAVAAARRAAERVRPLEPPVVEVASATGWRLAGRELLWLPRLLSSLAWVAAVAAVFALGRRAHSAVAGGVAAAYVALLPYGVSASRSIQPEPLLVATVSLALLELWRWQAAPADRRRLAAATAAVGAAVFVKVVALFVLLPVFAVVAGSVTSRDGWRQGGGGWGRALGFAAGALAPAAAWQVIGSLTGAFGGSASGRFTPGLWADGWFWRSWALRVDEVAGFLFAAAAVIAAGWVAGGMLRRFLLAAGAGYVLYGLAFSYHVATHDYYQLPFLPVVAVGVGVGVGTAVDWLRRRGMSLLAVGAAGAVPLALALQLAASPRAVIPGDGPSQAVLAQGRAVAATTGHDGCVLFLESAYGAPVRFHGHLDGRYWEPAGNVEDLEAAGQRVPPAAERLESARSEGCRWFVVNPRFLAGEHQLRAILDRAQPVEDRGRYRVYDMEDLR